MARLRLGRRRDRPAVDARRQLPGRPADPDARSRRGTATASATRRTSSAGTRSAARRSAAAHELDTADLAAQGRRRRAVIRARRAHPAGRARPRRRPADPAARLLLHRRHRPGDRRARRGAVLHRLPAGPADRSSCRSSGAGRPRTRSTSTSGRPAARLRLPARMAAGGHGATPCSAEAIDGRDRGRPRRAQSAAGPKIERTRSATARPRARWPAASRWIPSSGLTAATSPASRKSTPASAATSR